MKLTYGFLCLPGDYLEYRMIDPSLYGHHIWAPYPIYRYERARIARLTFRATA